MTITSAQLCEITGLTQRRHQQLSKEGHLPIPKDGCYPKDETMLAVIKYLRELVHRKSDDLKVWQKRLTKSKALISEWEDSQNRGEYVRKSEIGPALRNISLHQRATMLRKYEQELAPKLAGRTTIEILAEVKAANDEICRIFSESTKKWAENPP